MKKKKYLFALPVFALILFACSAGINLFSDKDDVELGEKFAQEIKDHPEQYPIYKGDPAVKDYINRKIFQEILQAPGITKTGIYNYQLELIANDSVLNAFAVPGGYVYVYTGLLKYLDSEAALAGVLGHEIAHDERRHATQRITRAYGLTLIANIALGNNPSQISEMVANLFSGLTLLANSRANEDEADEYSIKYLQSTRFYPGSVKFFFERLRDDGKVAKGGEGIQTFLSTHPDPIARISTTNQRLAALGIEIRSYTSLGDGIFRSEYEKNIKDKME